MCSVRRRLLRSCCPGPAPTVAHHHTSTAAAVPLLARTHTHRAPEPRFVPDQHTHHPDYLAHCSPSTHTHTAPLTAHAHAVRPWAPPADASAGTARRVPWARRALPLACVLAHFRRAHTQDTHRRTHVAPDDAMSCCPPITRRANECAGQEYVTTAIPTAACRHLAR